MALAPAAALAALPIAVLLVLMVGLRWPTTRAGIAALLVTLGLAFGVFEYGADELGRSRAVIGVLAEAGFSAFSIAWILLPALAIYHVQQRTGALDILQQSLRRITGEPAMIALLIAWFFALFLEGAAGFGTPVALAAPFLVSAGFRPVQAVTLASIGHAAGVAFGAVGTPIHAQTAITGIDPLELSRAAGSHVGFVGWLLPIALIVVVRRGANGRAWHGPGTWLWTLLAAAAFIVPYVAISRWIGPELPTLIGGLSGGVVFAMLVRARTKRDPTEESPIPTSRLLRASCPYLVVIALVLLTRLVAPIRRTVEARWEWSLFERFEGTIDLVQHPGTLLFLSLLLGSAVQRSSPRATSAALATAARQVVPVLVALIAVLAIARLMVHAGMIDALARAAARGGGPAWGVLAPFVGVLGTFVTGSATSSNILFTDFQIAAATHVGLGIPNALGLQTFGAAAGNMIAPMNLIAGAATVGLVGREGEILRRTLGVCVIYTLLGGLVAWLST